MSTLPPEVTAKLEAAGMFPSAIATDASEAFERAEFIPATIDKWIAKQKADKPHCFIDAAQADLETLAFRDGNMTARAKIVALYGENAAKERATAWGLKSLHDTKTRGKRPFAIEQPKVKGENPWSAEAWNITRQGAIAKADLALAQRLAKAAGSYIGATKPARAA